jgi:putative hemin transport protein
VDSSWVVREPLPEGVLTVLELFDGAGLPVARFACGRSPGEPEPEAWRDVLDALPAGEGEA